MPVRSPPSIWSARGATHRIERRACCCGTTADMPERSMDAEPPPLELGAATSEPKPSVTDTSSDTSAAAKSARERTSVVRPAQKFALLWIYWACKLPMVAERDVSNALCQTGVHMLTSWHCWRCEFSVNCVTLDVCCYLCRKNYPLLLPTLAKAGLLTTAEAGIVASVFEGVVGATKFFCGVFVDRHANPAQLLAQCLFVTGGSCLAMQATFWTARSVSLRVTLVALFWSLNGAGQAVRSSSRRPSLVLCE